MTARQLRAQLQTASEDFKAVEEAIRDQDSGRLSISLAAFRKSFDPVHEIAAQPPWQ